MWTVVLLSSSWCLDGHSYGVTVDSFYKLQVNGISVLTFEITCGFVPSCAECPSSHTDQLDDGSPETVGQYEPLESEVKWHTAFQFWLAGLSRSVLFFYYLSLDQTLIICIRIAWERSVIQGRRIKSGEHKPTFCRS